MHYTAMLAARGLGDEARAAREERLFLRFKADESAQAITARPRLLSPRTTTSARRSTSTRPFHSHPRRPAHGRHWSCGRGLPLTGVAIAAGRAGCSRSAPVPPPRTAASRSPTSPPQPASASSHNSGRAGKKWLPETLGSGVAFFDADGDGWQRHLLREQPRLEAARPPIAGGAVPEQRPRQVHRHHRRQRAGRRDVRHGRRRGRLRQRRPRRRLHHRARRRPPVPQRGRRASSAT